MEKQKKIKIIKGNNKGITTQENKLLLYTGDIITLYYCIVLL